MPLPKNWPTLRDIEIEQRDPYQGVHAVCRGDTELPCSMPGILDAAAWAIEVRPQLEALAARMRVDCAYADDLAALLAPGEKDQAPLCTGCHRRAWWPYQHDPECAALLAPKETKE